VLVTARPAEPSVFPSRALDEAVCALGTQDGVQATVVT